MSMKSCQPAMHDESVPHGLTVQRSAPALVVGLLTAATVTARVWTRKRARANTRPNTQIRGLPQLPARRSVPWERP